MENYDANFHTTQNWRVFKFKVMIFVYEGESRGEN
jgi:hypothetical protein